MVKLSCSNFRVLQVITKYSMFPCLAVNKKLDMCAMFNSSHEDLKPRGQNMFHINLAHQFLPGELEP